MVKCNLYYQAMGECSGKYFIENGRQCHAEEFDNLSIFEGDQVYEVIRVMEGVPLFFEDHMERLMTSITAGNREILAEPATIRDHILQLAGVNGVTDGNVKIVFRYTQSGKWYLVYFIEVHYPDNSQISGGVDTILFNAERRNPAVKLFNYRLRSSVLDTLVSKEAYEALLVNRHNAVTEGSRSNIFFVTGNSVVTAADKDVLGGITRKYVIDICHRLGIKILFRSMPVAEIGKADALFITGTSPQVLPVRRVDQMTFSPDNHISRLLADEYGKLVREYIASSRANS